MKITDRRVPNIEGTLTGTDLRINIEYAEESIVKHINEKMSIHEWVNLDNLKCEELGKKELIPFLNKIKIISDEAFRFINSISIEEIKKIDHKTWYVSFSIKTNKRESKKEKTFHCTQQKILEIQNIVDYALDEMIKELENEYKYLNGLLNMYMESDGFRIEYNNRNVTLPYLDWLNMNDKYCLDEYGEILIQYLPMIKGCVSTMVDMMVHNNRLDYLPDMKSTFPGGTLSGNLNDAENILKENLSSSLTGASIGDSEINRVQQRSELIGKLRKFAHISYDDAQKLVMEDIELIKNIINNNPNQSDIRRIINKLLNPSEEEFNKEDHVAEYTDEKLANKLTELTSLPLECSKEMVDGQRSMVVYAIRESCGDAWEIMNRIFENIYLFGIYDLYRNEFKGIIREKLINKGMSEEGICALIEDNLNAAVYEVMKTESSTKPIIAFSKKELINKLSEMIFLPIECASDMVNTNESFIRRLINENMNTPVKVYNGLSSNSLVNAIFTRYEDEYKYIIKRKLMDDLNMFENESIALTNRDLSFAINLIILYMDKDPDPIGEGRTAWKRSEILNCDTENGKSCSYI